MSEDSRSVHSYEVGDTSKGGAKGRSAKSTQENVLMMSSLTYEERRVHFSSSLLTFYLWVLLLVFIFSLNTES